MAKPSGEREEHHPLGDVFRSAPSIKERRGDTVFMKASVTSSEREIREPLNVVLFLKFKQLDHKQPTGW